MSVRRHLSPANALAGVALFAALGGSAYAAAALPRSSVGSTQLRANAVSSTKVRDRTLRQRDASRAEIAALRGPAGATGASGATGPRGDAGDTSALAAPGTLGSGEVLRAAFAAGEIVPTNQELTDGIDLPLEAPVPLDFAHVNVAGGIDDPTRLCSGTYEDPTAPPGYACLYPAIASNAKSLQATVPGGVATTRGFAVQFFAVATGPAELSGSWAYTDGDVHDLITAWRPRPWNGTWS